MRLSVLDQSISIAGCNQSDSIRQTLALAQQCEALGYHRFWVSEHHSHPSIAGTAPEVLLAAIAARTQRIRLGHTGALLPPEQADRDYSEAELPRLNALRKDALLGTGAQVAEKLRALAKQLEVEEIAIITWTHDASAQARSYALLAQEFMLNKPLAQRNNTQ
jgi:alkanesulfonate monooxygenase SsuD/methylene tetrahydromethanopterin reductase-like flavin-dependent oxidoreductase (luciferase family)